MDTNGSGAESYRIAFIGNFGAPYSTENDLRLAFKDNGHRVTMVSEQEPAEILALIDSLAHYQLVVWTSTKDYRDRWGEALQWKLIASCRRAGVPLVAYHLDRWWNLEREHWLDEPYFQIDLVVTADGGHDEMWAIKGINHRWLPPGVSERWCQPGHFREEYACDVVFVGGWKDYGHRAWTHRAEMISFLDRTYGSRLNLIPKINHPAIRGLELNDVYWSAKVVVGDSCLVPKVDGNPMTHYCSDRIPETMGRGGILVHPRVEGITERFAHYWWDLGDWSDLRNEIDGIIADGEDSARNRQHSIDTIREHHTYTVRVREFIDILKSEGLL